jgi:hypothetical protein
MTKTTVSEVMLGRRAAAVSRTVPGAVAGVPMAEIRSARSAADTLVVSRSRTAKISATTTRSAALHDFARPSRSAAVRWYVSG